MTSWSGILCRVLRLSKQARCALFSISRTTFVCRYHSKVDSAILFLYLACSAIVYIPSHTFVFLHFSVLLTVCIRRPSCRFLKLSSYLQEQLRNATFPLVVLLPSVTRIPEQSWRLLLLNVGSRNSTTMRVIQI